ncbi:glycosyltransferase involved in cell wall biosynthesis [Mucilaginibacter frigoritolerans]|jgi:glycosyltransferase involved in cell wall biosynthesis|uniref:Glycosyltransferase involved in cell wall biosynthesis n=1 Tax=Mucilaginibacter frigoritolerans TaxID=652788 RepID=A0A562UHM4_9SPHI|nr:glycosyltransferase [Mucilaginibacter frigoritolerans]TWJ04621.1 glycosyltransferase involved in cell wall biosynthesis [Mucilaginibacter frigoritolerans]
MKVLHIFNEIKFSGAEIMYSNAAPLFRDKGYELVAISTGESVGDFAKQFEATGIPVFHRPFKRDSKNPFYIFNYLKRIIQFIKDNDINIIHIHRSNVFWYFSLCGYLTGKKTIMTFHNVFKSRSISWIKHYLLRLTAKKWFHLTFQTIGESVYLNELNYYKNTTVQVNNWFDSNRFYPLTNSNEKLLIKEKLNIDNDAFIIISTGSCSTIKNHSDIIWALSILVKKMHIVYIHLGTGNLEGQEKALATELGVAKEVLFFNNKTNVRDYLVASDVFVMTSKFEGLSIASIEAMACQLPSVLYNSPGLRDLIKNNDYGLLIAPRYNILAESIFNIWQNPELAKQRALNALNNVNLNYSMEASVNKISMIYNGNL